MATKQSGKDIALNTGRISNGVLHDGVAYWARRSPDKTAFSLDGDERISYGELDRWSNGFAEHLQSLGIAPGNHVAIAAANCLNWVPAALAILKCGGVITPYNDRLVGNELKFLADYSEARMIIADEARRDVLKSADISTPLLSLEDIDKYRSGASASWSPVRVDSSSVAMIIFTSGSTARPKGAMMTHGNYLAKFMEMRLLDENLGPSTRSLMPFGLHSSPGLPWGILFTTTLGGTLYATKKYDAENLLCTLAQEKISFFIGVPMIYEQLSQLDGFRNADLSHLGFARVGGATPNAATLQRWKDAGIAVRQLYGMTEVGGGSIIATAEEALAKPESCGRGLAFSRFRIVRDDGTACDPDEVGHILLQGPGLMAGYWRDPDATAAALADGWMHTGDMGKIDEEGYFTFVDRSKEMIKCGGFNVSPSELEGKICELDGIVEVSVIGVADDKYTEVPCACVHMKPSLTPRMVFDYCAGHMAKFKLPRYIVPLKGPLPRLANEKIDRRKLKEDYGSLDKLPDRIDN